MKICPCCRELSLYCTVGIERVLREQGVDKEGGICS
jgi:hypothetical protein